ERAESRAARPRAPRAGGARVASAQTRCTEVGMKWVLASAGVIVVLVAAAVVLGMLLPRDHVVARAARIAAPPDSVWRLITTPADFPAWRTDLTGVEL